MRAFFTVCCSHLSSLYRIRALAQCIRSHQCGAGCFFSDTAADPTGVYGTGLVFPSETPFLNRARVETINLKNNLTRHPGVEMRVQLTALGLALAFSVLVEALATAGRRSAAVHLGGRREPGVEEAPQIRLRRYLCAQWRRCWRTTAPAPSSTWTDAQGPAKKSRACWDSCLA